MPVTWSKRRKTSATTKRLSGRFRAVGGQRHGRLERRDVVVAQVADHGCVERLRLRERDEPRAAADEGVAAQASLVDRLEQERRAPVRAQPEVCRERGEEVGVEVVEVIARTERPRGSSVERAGCGAASARAPARWWAGCAGRVGRSSAAGQLLLECASVAGPRPLAALLHAPGPSGHEEEPARIWRDAASAFAEVTSDTLGTSFARVRAAAKDAATLALVGHIDEIGVTVTNIEENGLLSFTTVGGISPETLSGQRIEFLTQSGAHCRARSPASRIAPEERGDAPELELADLHIDIGARVARRGGGARPRRRRRASGTARRSSCRTGGCMSRSLDNRLGAYVVLEAARRIGEAKDVQVDIVAVAATQEELGSYGARAAAYGLDPRVAIAVDVTPATDYPGGDPRRAGRVELGMGAMIARGPTLNKQVVELLAEAAEAEGIPHAFEIYTRATSTDADEFHLSAGGRPDRADLDPDALPAHTERTLRARRRRSRRSA